MKYDAHLGGESTLEFAGCTHHVRFGERPRVQFYVEVPPCLKRLPMQTQVVVRRRTLFGGNPIDVDDVDDTEARASRSKVDVWR